MKYLPKSTLLLLFSLSMLFFAACDRTGEIGIPINSEKPAMDLPLVSSSTITETVDFTKPFCEVEGTAKAAFHSGKIQKNFDCIDTLFFHVERWSRFANRNYQIAEITKGIEIAKGFTDRDFAIKFTGNIEKADMIFVWGKTGDTVPPNNDPMISTLGAAYLPTDDNVNGYIYLKDAITYTSPKSLLHKIIAHEVGHWLGFLHTDLNDYACMNPRAQTTTEPTFEENILGVLNYPVEDCN